MVSVSQSSWIQVSANDGDRIVSSPVALSRMSRGLRASLLLRFSACTDDGRSIIADFFVVRPNSCGLGELLAVARDICSLRPNNADQVVDCFHFVVRDLEEEGSDGLLKSCKVRVGQLFDNRLKVVKGVVEFRHDLLGCHSAPNMARPSY